MDCSRPRTQRNRVFRTDFFGKFDFERIDIRTKWSNPVGPERLIDKIPLGLAHVRGREQYLLIYSTPLDQVDDPPLAIDNREVIDHLSLHHLQRLAPCTV